VFERFGSDARYVVVWSQEEARELDHDHIGTEHFLLALTHDEAGSTAAVLGGFGVTTDRARAEVAQRVPVRRSPTAHIPFTPDAKRLLEDAVTEARARDRSTIRAQHLLLALLALDEGVAAQVLVALGADRAEIRQRLDLP
jgi:ATP-dependent Clp protease ATP-binding subunit ClpC